MPDRTAEEGVHEAIARLHAAIRAIAGGDVRAIKALYSHADDVTAFYGWGGYEKGWAEVGRRWDWAARQFQGGEVSYRNLTTVVTPRLAYTTDIETFRVRLAGRAEPVEWTNRVTHVFRLEDGEWRLVHRHGNRLEPQHEPGDGVGRGATP
jgi:ketosteroid isomerase-like protein